jgi:hypothetical protein
MFRALLAHLKEALHKQQSVYCVRVTMLAATRFEVGGSTSNHQHARNIPIVVCGAPPEDE